MRRSVFARLRSFFATNLEEYRLFFAVLGILSLILGVVAFLMPAEIELPDNITYQHTGLYTYSASAPSEVYQGGKLESGAAIFPTVSCQVDTVFYYLFSSNEAALLQGTYQWTAELSSSNGWKQNILSLPETSFEGTSLTTRVTLDVCAMEQVIQQVESITDLHNYQYLLTLSPNIQVTGEVGGMPLEDTVSAPLRFTVEPQQIFLQVENTENNPLQPTQSGEIARWRTSVNNLPILSMKLPIPLARWIALGGLLLSAIALALPNLFLRGKAESDEALAATTMFGKKLVEVRGLSIDASSQFVQVRNLADLSGLADQLSEKVLLQITPNSADYYVLSGRTVYLFQKSIPVAATEPILEEQIRQGIRENQFIIYYQPAISLETGEITHVEASLRWRHPNDGLLLMDEFSPQVEKYGLSALVDSWALNHICEQMAVWHKNETLPCSVEVNFSDQSLRMGVLANTVQQTLQEKGLNPSSIDVSIHERELRGDPIVVRNLRTLREMGVGITVDISANENYAVVYEDVNARLLKLGCTGLLKLAPLPSNDDFFQHAVLWAHEYEMQVCAVGVATKQQLKYLRQIGCDQAQGDLISPPLIAQDIQPYFEGHVKPLQLMDL
ncbi:MAG: EAL domain-containing protein [Anaerolineaceae bacterium]